MRGPCRDGLLPASDLGEHRGLAIAGFLGPGIEWSRHTAHYTDGWVRRTLHLPRRRASLGVNIGYPVWWER